MLQTRLISHYLMFIRYVDLITAIMNSVLYQAILSVVKATA